jgi:hypothetical protein
MNRVDLEDGAGCGCVVVILWIVLAWLTHVIVCIKTASWLFLIAGAIMFPIALVHGTGYWFGVW